MTRPDDVAYARERRRKRRAAERAASAPRYVVVTLADARRIAAHLGLLHALGPDARRIRDRLAAEEGAALQEVVEDLQGLEICGACDLEGTADHCSALWARASGRRLRRLLERARGERGEGARPASDDATAEEELQAAYASRHRETLEAGALDCLRQVARALAPEQRAAALAWVERAQEDRDAETREQFEVLARRLRGER